MYGKGKNTQRGSKMELLNWIETAIPQIASLTPSGALMLGIIMILTGKLVPIKQVEKMESVLTEAIERERRTKDAVQHTLEELTAQNAISLEILKKLEASSSTHGINDVESEESVSENV